MARIFLGFKRSDAPSTFSDAGLAVAHGGQFCLRTAEPRRWGPRSTEAQRMLRARKSMGPSCQSVDAVARQQNLPCTELLDSRAIEAKILLGLLQNLPGLVRRTQNYPKGNQPKKGSRANPKPHQHQRSLRSSPKCPECITLLHALNSARKPNTLGPKPVSPKL